MRRFSVLYISGFFLILLSCFSQNKAHAKFDTDYDIESYCQKIMLFSPDQDPAIYKNCLMEERLAKKDIEVSDVGEETMGHCLDVSQASQVVGLGASYTLLKSCIDQEIEAIERYEARQISKSDHKAQTGFSSKNLR